MQTSNETDKDQGMIVVAGEALFDVIENTGTDRRPSSRNTGSIALEAYPGGSPFNCALALGCLNTPVRFASILSDDTLGDRLYERMTVNGVGLIDFDRTTAPTPLAMVTRDSGGEPYYRFYFQNTAYYEILKQDVESRFPPGMRALHIGSLALMDVPSAAFWLPIAQRLEKAGVMISLDPNVREMLVDDMQGYRDRLEAFWPICSIVKVSSADLEFLYPDAAAEDSFATLVDRYTPILSVLTHGDQGSQAHLVSGVKTTCQAWKPAQNGDNVGAGDCFHAGMLAWLSEHGYLNGPQLRALSEEQLQTMLACASRASGINCGRNGCQPPARNELLEFFATRG